MQHSIIEIFLNWISINFVFAYEGSAQSSFYMFFMYLIKKNVSDDTHRKTVFFVAKHSVCYIRYTTNESE